MQTVKISGEYGYQLSVILAKWFVKQGFSVESEFIGNVWKLTATKGVK